jgi:hypothetical protein
MQTLSLLSVPPLTPKERKQRDLFQAPEHEGRRLQIALPGIGEAGDRRSVNDTVVR